MESGVKKKGKDEEIDKAYGKEGESCHLEGWELPR